MLFYLLIFLLVLVTICKHSIEIISFFFKFFFSHHWTSAASFNMFKVWFWTHGSHVTPGTWQTPLSWVTFFSRFSWVSWKKDVLMKKDSISRLFFTFTPFRYLCRVHKILLVFFRKRVSTPPRLNHQHYQGLLELLVAQADQVDMGCQNLFLPSPETVYHCCSPNQTPTNKHRDWE